MSPAAHAAVGAALAGRIPRLAVSLPLAFLSHMAMDAVWHFEAFYPLARWLDVSRGEAFWAAAIVLGGLTAPPMLWLARKDKDLFLFLGLAVSWCVTMRIPGWERKAVLSAAALLLYLALTRSKKALIWSLGATAAAWPDILKFVSYPFYRFHSWAHYSSGSDLGRMINQALGGEAMFIWERFTSIGYVIGYGLEAAIEATLLLGGLWVMARQADAIRVERNTSTADREARSDTAG